MGEFLDILKKVRDYGADLRLYQGQLQVRGGKSRLPPLLIEHIKSRRQEIVATLTDDSITECIVQHHQQRRFSNLRPTQVSTVPVKKVPSGKKSTRSILIQHRKESFRHACSWLLPRLGNLMALGWDKMSLFKVGNLAYPLFWGLAWHEIWKKSAAIELTPGGEIIFKIVFPVETGNTVTQVARPP